MPALTFATVSTEAVSLVKRQYGYGYDCYYGDCNSNWYNWGRWVLLGCIIAAAILVALIVSCMNARHRRKHGAQPVYGTAWMAPQHGNVNYYPDQNQPNPDYAPPAYPAATNGNQGYNQPYMYGNGNDIPLQQPGATYQPNYMPQNGGDNVYQPPEGPPPGKTGKRGIFR